VGLEIDEGVNVGGTGLDVCEGTRVGVRVEGEKVEEGDGVIWAWVGGLMGNELIPHAMRSNRKKIITK